MKSDSEIRRDVEDELRWEPSVDARDIGVAVKDGVVTLGGHVANYTEKINAEEAAKRVAGVAGVANEIAVRLPGAAERPDSDIARDAAAALNALPGVAGRVRPTVRSGWVVLDGTVQWNYEREGAEAAVRHIAGVRGVTSQLHLAPASLDLGVGHAILEAFQRNAEIDAKAIRIEIKDGAVVLSGVVRSWAERKAAERAAWAAPGIVKVDNRLAVAM